MEFLINESSSPVRRSVNFDNLSVRRSVSLCRSYTDCTNNIAQFRQSLIALFVCSDVRNVHFATIDIGINNGRLEMTLGHFICTVGIIGTIHLYVIKGKGSREKLTRTFFRLLIQIRC